jgi:hypothetical protein
VIRLHKRRHSPIRRTWDTAAQNALADIEPRAFSSDTYKALNTCLKGYDSVLQNAVSGNKGAMRAYLAFMGPRFAEIHRALTSEGSIYLPCNPTALHCGSDIFISTRSLHEPLTFKNGEINQGFHLSLQDICLTWAQAAV